MSNYQEERMKQLFGSLPQNRGVEWDAVTPVIDFQFSKHSDPVRARRQNIKRAMKTLKPVKRWTGIFGYKYNNRPLQCVVTGVDCTHQDYGDLRQELLLDHKGREKAFTPWTGVLPQRGRPMVGTHCPQALQYKLLIEGWTKKSARTNVVSSSNGRRGCLHSHQEARSEGADAAGQEVEEASLKRGRTVFPNFRSRTTSGGPKARSCTSHTPT